MTKIEDKLQRFYDDKAAQARAELQQQLDRDAEAHALKQQFLKLVTDVIQEPCEAFCKALEKRGGAADFHAAGSGARARVEVTRLPDDEWYPFMEPRTVFFIWVADHRMVRIEYHPDALGKGQAMPPEKLTMELVEDALLRLLVDIPHNRPAP